tara:strand:- start:1112 stop:1636 length:525 start_codon:yes stop_codon:yes gene_type:complete
MAKYLFLLFFVLQISAEEMIIGKEKIKPGIDITFEAAPKDTIHPEGIYLKENATDIHIEMLANWSNENPYDFPTGGFVPYLSVLALIESNNGESVQIDLAPHINLIDSLHYAKNIQLPGKIDDIYNVTFFINADQEVNLGIHNDWHKKVGPYISKHTFVYKDLSFKKIANTIRQ